LQIFYKQLEVTHFVTAFPALRGADVRLRRWYRELFCLHLTSSILWQVFCKHVEIRE